MNEKLYIKQMLQQHQCITQGIIDLLCTTAE